MPVCSKCERIGPSADMRRSTTPGLFNCKDKQPCGERRTMLRKIRRYQDGTLRAKLDAAREGKTPDSASRMWLRLLEVEYDRRFAKEGVR